MDAVPDPCGFSVRGTALLALTCGGELVEIDAAAPKIARRRALGGEASGLSALVASGDALWVLLQRRAQNALRGVVLEIDARSLVVRTTHDLGTSIPIAADPRGDDLFVVTLDGRLLAIHDSTAKDLAPRGDANANLSIAGDVVWVVGESGSVTKRGLDGRVIQRENESAPLPIAAEAVGDRLWVALGDGGIKIFGRPSRTLPGSANDIEQCGSTIWLSQQDFGGSGAGMFGIREYRADGTEVRTTTLDVEPRFLACGASEVWVLAQSGVVGSVRR